MIPTNKKPWFSRLFAWYVRRKLLRSFSSVYVRGLDAFATLARQRPVLWVSNHTAWWDSMLVLDLCSHTLGLDPYAMMDARSLRALPFLGWIGGFGVELHDKAEGEKSVAYAASLLDAPQKIVAIFPQGREQPVTLRPLRFFSGAARIAMLAKDAAVVPVSLRYEHGRFPKPDLFITIGAPVATGDGVVSTTHALEAAVTAQLDDTQEQLHDGRAHRWPKHLGGNSSPGLGVKLLARTGRVDSTKFPVSSASGVSSPRSWSRHRCHIRLVH